MAIQNRREAIRIVYKGNKKEKDNFQRLCSLQPFREEFSDTCKGFVSMA